MLFEIFCLILILASLIGLGFIVVRKFPQLAAIEVEKLEEVKQAQVKEEIKLLMFKRALSGLGRAVKEKIKFLSLVKAGWEKLQTAFRIKVRQFQERYKKTILEEVKKQKKPKKIGTQTMVTVGALLRQADEALQRGDLTFAERKYIEVIKQDQKNIEAYRGLGKVYMDMEKYGEAEETFNFLLKLVPRDDRIYNRLGMVAEREGDWEKAARYFEKAIELDDSRAIRFYDLGWIYEKQNRPAPALKCYAKAVKLEPNNPKYLDRLLEMSIISKDKDLAEAVLQKLKAVNPENQKLGEFKERIGEIES
ncbi:MAG: tetratricopeptide repeat protein [Candidatus Magasanikbacteria bacterium]|nr:tetratricopeptide repeat protein [Candidatus Magasanikbacteria bacterium]